MMKKRRQLKCNFYDAWNFILHQGAVLKESAEEEIDELVYINSDGTLLLNVDTHNWIQPYKNKAGRMIVKLKVNGKFKEFQVGKLVLGAWVGVPATNIEEYVAHHKNFNPSNNGLENLEWLTRSDHIRKHDIHRPRKIIGVE